MRLSIDAYERMAGNILKIYEQAEIEMTRRVANRIKRGVTQPGWTEQKYSEMKAVTRQMSKVVDSLHRDFNVQAMQYVETGYEDGRSSFINEAREFADLSQIHELTPTAIKIANIMGDLDMSMSAADRLILRQANDAYANIIGETSALIATGSYTEKQAVQIALNRFADKGISSFVDKAGRHWEMTTYAEMATLTAIERATRQGYTDTMQEFGFDLAIISSHYGACPLCEAWENVVISISGKDTHYLSLADAEAGGCFHPRCMHVFSTYYDGITRGGRDRPSPVGPANPGYAARSQQRSWERQERKWKRRMAAATTPEEERTAYARVRMYQDKIRGLVADYNNTVDPSVDYLPRKYDREGGRVKLSNAAKKLRPVVIPQAQPAAVSKTDFAQTSAQMTRAEYLEYKATKGVKREAELEQLEKWYLDASEKLTDEFGGSFFRQRSAIRRDETLTDEEKEAKYAELEAKKEEKGKREEALRQEVEKRRQQVERKYSSVFIPEYEYAKIDGPRTIRENSRETNPMLNKMLDSTGRIPYEYSHNCQRCCIAYEMRQRGFAVHADKAPPEGGVLARTYISKIFSDAETVQWYGTGHANTLRAREIVTGWGEGARGIALITRNGEAGHAFNVACQDGKFWIIDGQMSSAWNDAEDGVSMHGGAFEEAATDSVVLIRTDNTKVYEIPDTWLVGDDK